MSTRHHPKRRRVRILNPIDDNLYTSRSAAWKAVSLGRAVLEPGGLRILSREERLADRRRIAMGRILVSPPPDAISNTGRATLDQVEGLPVAGDAIRVFMHRSRRGCGKGKV